MAIWNRGPAIRRGLILLSTALLGVVAGAVCAADPGVTYEYDSAGRLRKATYDDTTAVSYTLDAPGNRTTVATTLPFVAGAPGVPSFSNITGATATASWTAASGSVTGYRYRLNSGTWNSPSPATSTSVNLSGLASYTSYSVDVQAGYAGEIGRAS